MKNKSFDEIFRHQLGDLRIEPSDRAKELMEMGIRKRGRIILYRRISIAAGIVLIATLGYLFLTPENELHNLVQQESGQETFSAEKGSDKNLEEGKNDQQAEMNERDNPLPDESRDMNPEMKTDAVAQEKNQDQPAVADYPGENRPAERVPVAEVMSAIPARSPEYSVITPDGVKPGNTAKVPEKTDIIPAADETLTELALVEEDSVPAVPEQVQEGDGKAREPVKITIEYIASGSGKSRDDGRQNNVRDLYSKMNKLVYPEAVLGDIRTFKDQLFALDFINERKSETQIIIEK